MELVKSLLGDAVDEEYLDEDEAKQVYLQAGELYKKNQQKALELVKQQLKDHFDENQLELKTKADKKKK